MKSLGRSLKILGFLLFLLWLAIAFGLQVAGLQLLTGWGRMVCILLGFGLLLLPVIGWGGLIYAGYLALTGPWAVPPGPALGILLLIPALLIALFIFGDWLHLGRPGLRARRSWRAKPHARAQGEPAEAPATSPGPGRR